MIECRSGTIIQSIHHKLNLLIGHFVKVCSFREILPYLTVGVFVAAPFPDRIRMGKIHIGIQSRRYLFMRSKFQTIVKGDGLHLVRNIPHALRGGLGQ